MAKRPDDALEKEQLAGINHPDEADQPPRKKSKNACMFRQ